MFRMYASNSHSYTHLILALGIVRKPTVWYLLLQNILAHMTLACLLMRALVRAVLGPAWLDVNGPSCWHTLVQSIRCWHSVGIRCIQCMAYNTTSWHTMLAYNAYSHAKNTVVLSSRNLVPGLGDLEVEIPPRAISTQNTIIIRKQHSNIHSLLSGNTSCDTVRGL